MTIMDCRPFLAVGVSFLAAVLISFSRRYPNVRESWSVIASFIKFGLIISMVPGVLAGVTYEWTLFQITDTIGFTLRAVFSLPVWLRFYGYRSTSIPLVICAVTMSMSKQAILPLLLFV
mgnify:CR=1 FL=1